MRRPFAAGPVLLQAMKSRYGFVCTKEEGGRRVRVVRTFLPSGPASRWTVEWDTDSVHEPILRQFFETLDDALTWLTREE